MGNSYQVLFTILDLDNSSLGSMPYIGTIPEDYSTGPGSEVMLSSSFIVYDSANPPGIKINLNDFNFSIAFYDTLDVNDIVVLVQKLEQ